MKKKLDGKHKEIIEKYKNGLSTTQIGAEYGVAHQSINKLLRKHNVRLRNIRDSLFLRVANYTEISKKTSDMIDGWLLGDGSIIYSGTKQAYFQHVSIHKEYIEYVKNIFEQDGIKCNFCRLFSKNSQSYYWKLYTCRTIQLKRMYDKWYKDRIKIVPKDIIITPELLKCWIMDDGSVDKRDGILSLHTNAFKKEECQDLVEKIKKFLGDGKISIIMCKGKYPRINISRITTNKLFNIIGKCELDCFSYKWENNFTCINGGGLFYA